MSAHPEMDPIVRGWLGRRADGAGTTDLALDRLLRLVDATPQDQGGLSALGRTWRGSARARRSTGRSLAAFATVALLILVALVPIGASLLSGTSVSPAPQATVPTESVATLRTAPVAPGVERILGDSAGHDLTAEGSSLAGVDTHGNDVWLAQVKADEMLHLLVLGRPDEAIPLMSLLPGTTVDPARTEPARPASGTVTAPAYLSFGYALSYGYDGGTWLPAAVELPPGVGSLAATAAGPDGRLWVAWFDPAPTDDLKRDGPWHGRIVLGHLDADGWTTDPVPDSVMATLPPPWACTRNRGCDSQTVYYVKLAVDGAGNAWVGLTAGVGGNPPGSLLRFASGAWDVVDPIGDGVPRAVDQVVRAPDGSLWAHLHGCVGEVELDPPGTASPCAEMRDPYLAHLVGGAWKVYSAEDGVPMLGTPRAIAGAMAVAPDGTVWMSASCGARNTTQPDMYRCGPGREHDAIHVFDGTDWRSMLSDSGPGDIGSPSDIAVAADGTVWVWTDDGHTVLRITPG